MSEGSFAKRVSCFVARHPPEPGDLRRVGERWKFRLGQSRYERLGQNIFSIFPRGGMVAQICEKLLCVLFKQLFHCPMAHAYARLPQSSLPLLVRSQKPYRFTL